MSSPVLVLDTHVVRLPDHDTALRNLDYGNPRLNVYRGMGMTEQHDSHVQAYYSALIGW
jgi:hypothetical protein